MPEEGRLATVVAIAGYNLIQNLIVPVRAYVPANLVATLGLVAMARRYGCTWDDLGLKLSHIRKGFRLGLTGVAASTALAVAVGGNQRTRKYLLDQRAAGQRRDDIVFRVLVRLPLGTALFEEVAFRGVIDAIWRRSGAAKREAAIAAAIAFGLWHLIPGTQALTGNPLDERIGSPGSRAGVVVIGAFLTSLSSLGFTRMRELSGSLLAPWMTHAAINSAGYLAGVAAWRTALKKR